MHQRLLVGDLPVGDGANIRHMEEVQGGSDSC